MEVLHHTMHDGVVQYARMYEGKGPALIIFPDFGESIKDNFWTTIRSHLPGHAIYVVELRGHSLSGGAYTLDNHWHDIQYWILRAIKKHKEVVVIAKGLSASILLNYESQVHLLHETRRPPLPVGMVLLAPWFEGRKVSWKSCRKTSKQVLKSLRSFVLPPVRIQTPTKIFIPYEDYSMGHLKKIFGTCATEKVRWLHKGHNPTRIELMHGLKQISEAVDEISEAERPIRFSTKL